MVIVHQGDQHESVGVRFGNGKVRTLHTRIVSLVMAVKCNTVSSELLNKGSSSEHSPASPVTIVAASLLKSVQTNSLVKRDNYQIVDHVQQTSEHELIRLCKLYLPA